MSVFAAATAGAGVETSIMMISWSFSIISACPTPSVITVIGR